MNKIFLFSICYCISFTAFCQQATRHVQDKKKITIQFENVANARKIILNDSLYSNAFGEKYSVQKLKYYVSNISLLYGFKKRKYTKVFLIDAGKENKIVLPAEGGSIRGIQFLVGVDSLQNLAGAQEGALDPLNDMYWTWNSGFVMFKLEGSSDSSHADKKRIEQHIGGFKGLNKTMQMVTLLVDKKDKITITMNLDKYWDGKQKIRFAEMPVITAMGENAVKASGNFPEMFSAK